MQDRDAALCQDSSHLVTVAARDVRAGDRIQTALVVAVRYRTFPNVTIDLDPPGTLYHGQHDPVVVHREPTDG